MSRLGKVVAGILATWTLLLLSVPAQAGDTVTRIKARRNLRCGVSDGILGLSVQDQSGRWSGMDVDFCRALGAAVLGDSEKVSYVPLAAAARFSALKGGEVDVLVRNTTWTLEREAVLGVLFTGILYYEEQGFLVSKSSGVQELSQLNGATICVVRGTNHEGNLAQIFGVKGWDFQPQPLESPARAVEALHEGRCKAYTSEKPQLISARREAAGGSDQYIILPEEISTVPMGPVVLWGDDEWFTLVRWILFALIRAEEGGYTQANVRSRLDHQDDYRARSWKELDGLIAKSLNIDPGWGIRVVESVGNYGEIFERNLGEHSSLKLERGLNKLWKDGGLMYAPPFR
ncbi:MAG: amino acid ABC transporter substrate-binding protein [Desulfoferrobacter sp.]